jgi:hypothetical protein
MRTLKAVMGRSMLFGALLFAFTAGSAHAGPIDWNTWTSSSTGSITVGVTSIVVGFATVNDHADIASYPSWTPASTYADGTIVSNAPVAANGIMQLFGGTNASNILTFSTPVTNPVMAIWSLGSGGTPASFVFGAVPTFVAGGPSAEYGGSAITVSGSTVSGQEGNGSVQFHGTFSSISWTNPQFENWYGFNVGVAGVAAPTPEPSTFALASLGGLVLAGYGWRKRRRTVA